MVTYFNKKDLVAFGRYLLSEQRAKSILLNHDESCGISNAEKLSEVYHADVENFLNSNKTK